MARMTMVVDLDRCIGCYACEIACKQENDVALGTYRVRVNEVGPFGDFPDVQMYWMPATCQHCENPTCVEVCPTGASVRQEDGVVTVDKNVCIGCQLCSEACPYGARSYDKKNSIVEKCDLCQSLRANGDKPACVKCCSGNARFFGDIDDPHSDAAKELARVTNAEAIHQMADKGTQPTVRYILHDQVATWQE